MNIFDAEGLIDSEVQDILYELGNVGLGMASITVGRLMGARLNIGVPNIVPVTRQVIEDIMGRPGQVSIATEFQKTLKGFMVLVMDTPFVNKIVDRMTEQGGTLISEADRRSAIEEFANIISAAYLKAVGQYTDMRIYVKPVGIDNISPENIYGCCNKAICVDTSFSMACEDGGVIDEVGHVIMLPEEESVEKLVKPLCD